MSKEIEKHGIDYGLVSTSAEEDISYLKTVLGIVRAGNLDVRVVGYNLALLVMLRLAASLNAEEVKIWQDKLQEEFGKLLMPSEYENVTAGFILALKKHQSPANFRKQCIGLGIDVNEQKKYRKYMAESVYAQVKSIYEQDRSIRRHINKLYVELTLRQCFTGNRVIKL